MTVKVKLKRPGRPVTAMSAKAVAQRDLRKKWRKNGLCVTCGARRARAGVLCPRCRGKSVDRQRRLREERMAHGACQECGEPAYGKSRCLDCAKRRSDRPSRLRENRKSENIAWHAKVAKRARRWLAQGLCRSCGASCADGALLCERHEEARKVHNRALNFKNKTTVIARHLALEAQHGSMTTEVQAAVLLGVTTHTVINYLRAGKIPHGRLGPHYRMRCDDVVDFLQERDRQRSLAELETEAARDRRAKQLAQWRRDGLCVECGAKRSPSSTRVCEDHRRLINERGRDAAARRKDPGLAGLITCTEAARIVGISDTCMRLAAEVGRIPYVRVGCRWKFKPADVERFAIRRRHRG